MKKILLILSLFFSAVTLHSQVCKDFKEGIFQNDTEYRQFIMERKDNFQLEKSTEYGIFYQVTRDAPVMNSTNPIADDCSFNVNNSAFEPSQSNGAYQGIMDPDYPRGTSLPAIALRNEREEQV